MNCQIRDIIVQCVNNVQPGYINRSTTFFTSSGWTDTMVPQESSMFFQLVNLSNKCPCLPARVNVVIVYDKEVFLAFTSELNMNSSSTTLDILLLLTAELSSTWSAFMVMHKFSFLHTHIDMIKQ